MFWNKPHLIKVYEALSAIADGRIEYNNSNQAKCFSTSGNKFYTITWDPVHQQIMSNDNSAYYTDTLSYPMIAMLLLNTPTTYQHINLDLVKDIHWKDINQKFKNDYDQALAHYFKQVAEKGISEAQIEQLKNQVGTIYNMVMQWQLEPLGKKIKPPAAY